MLEFRNVTFQYDVEDFNIIDDLSFHIGKGEFVSVIGPSGCGKSTIFRLTGQLLTRKSGDILVGGESIDGRRGYCGYMPQRDLLFPWRTVNENLRLPMEVRGGIPRAEMDRRVAETLEHVGLAGWGDKRPEELSGGMRQRAAFARTLLTGSELLLLDEPFSALPKLCIEYGRPVLCEKAFTWTAEEAAEVLQLAKEKQVFITEAMWVRYMPMFRMLKETVDSGKIGAVTAVTANLGYALLHKERVTRPELAGGALLDLGVYTLNFATGLLGDEPERIETTMVRLITGVDKQEFVNLIYPNGVVAGLFNTMVSVTDRKGFIYGTEGHIEVENINNYEEFRIYNNQYELTETIRRPEQLTGYEYEVRACHRALLNGQLECEEMPHVHTMRIMHMLDEIQKKWEEQKA